MRLSRPAHRSALGLGATALAAVLVTSTAAYAPASTGALGSLDVLGSLGESTGEFDLQAHRGGVGMHVESTPQAFAAAMELGVTTLELDLQVTADREVVITHDRLPRTDVCQDTEPVTPDDPQFPYMDNYIHELTLEQVRTLDCGSIQRPGYPDQVTHPGEPMMLLSELFDLVREYGADGEDGVMMNIETKVEAGAPEETAPRDEFVAAVHSEIAESGLADQITIQSFDWGALMAMHDLEPGLPLVALTNHNFLGLDSDEPSPWLGGIDIDDFDGDGVAAAASIEGVTAYSPVTTYPDQSCEVGQDDCEPYVTDEMVSSAHAHDLEIIPWTVNNVPTMEYLLDLGVDGIITDYPNVLRELMAERGMPLPRPYAAPA